MDLPSTRELELEALLRRRDAQISELNDEVLRLRQYLTTQSAPSTSDQVTLPPPLVSLLLPHLETPLSASSGASHPHDSVYSALAQRTTLLQEENEELYGILKHGETGRLKDEVRGLQRVVDKLQKALRESHQVISSLSTELQKSYDTIMTTARQNNNVKPSRSHSPRDSYHASGNGSSRNLPTGPRAHKKPRLSEPQHSPPPPSRAAPPQRSNKHLSGPPPSRSYDSERSSHYSSGNRRNDRKMDVDEDSRTRPRTPDPTGGGRDRGSHREFRDRERERDGREYENDRNRDRDAGRARRNGNYSAGPSGRGGGRRPERAINNRDGSTGYPNSGSGNTSSADRTLAQRMGL